MRTFFTSWLVLATMVSTVTAGETPEGLQKPSGGILKEVKPQVLSEEPALDHPLVSNAIATTPTATPTATPTSRPSKNGEPASGRTPSSPVFASFRSQQSQVAPARSKVLGMRDDSREGTYHLEGRGVEKGAGKRSGRYCEPGLQRAGNPDCISRHAQPGIDRDHTVGYIGGGTPFSHWGECRTSQEGTFGMDYSGWLFHRNTWLLWSHGGLYQGGAGRYESEGPRILPEK
ncbi:MAG: hypothetical protein WCI02_13025 [Planctomycetota bacterium]|jgi:hypothetical protein